MKKTLFGGVAGLLVVLSAPAAHASFQGYVCSSTLYKDTSSFGDHGFISVSFYSGANCTGSYLGYHYFCTQGTTNMYCPAEPYKLYSEAAIWALQNELIEAGRSGTKVASYDSPCRGGTTNLCGHSVRFGY